MADEIIQQQVGSSSKKNRKILFWVGYVVVSSIIAFFGTFVFILLTEKPQPKQMAGAGADSSMGAMADSAATAGRDSMSAALDSMRIDSLSSANPSLATGTESPVEESTGPKFALSSAEAAEPAEAKQDTEPPPDYKQLAKIYSNMKSQAAAKILSRLDDSMVVGILSEMRDREAAKVLTAITPDRAAILSEKMSKFESRN